MTVERKEFDDSNFYTAFCEDLQTAKSFVIIQSPFIRTKRAEMLRPLFTECVERGVQVCVFIQRPREEDPDSRTKLNEAVEMLTRAGVHVSSAPNIHEKLAVIDASILWRGSLNILSQSKSSEEMFREVNPAAAYATLKGKRLDTCSACRDAGERLFKATDVFQSFGRAVKTARKRVGWTQQKLAERCKTDQQRVSLLERGQSNLTLETLQNVCNALMLNPVFIPWEAKHFMANQLRSVNDTAKPAASKVDELSLARKSQQARAKLRTRKKHRYTKFRV